MKLFTVEEANSLLPSVRPIVKSIQKSHRRLAGFQTAAKQAAEGAESGGGGFEEGPRYARILVELSTSAGKLERLGIQLKDSAAERMRRLASARSRYKKRGRGSAPTGDLGLDRGGVSHNFEDYCSRFGIPCPPVVPRILSNF